eukprot:2495157-Pyramimonas_sp.AAC.1
MPRRRQTAALVLSVLVDEMQKELLVVDVVKTISARVDKMIAENTSKRNMGRRVSQGEDNATMSNLGAQMGSTRTLSPCRATLSLEDSIPPKYLRAPEKCQRQELLRVVRYSSLYRLGSEAYGRLRLTDKSPFGPPRDAFSEEIPLTWRRFPSAKVGKLQEDLVKDRAGLEFVRPLKVILPQMSGDAVVIIFSRVPDDMVEKLCTNLPIKPLKAGRHVVEALHHLPVVSRNNAGTSSIPVSEQGVLNSSELPARDTSVTLPRRRRTKSEVLNSPNNSDMWTERALEYTDNYESAQLLAAKKDGNFGKQMLMQMEDHRAVSVCGMFERDQVRTELESYTCVTPPPG